MAPISLRPSTFSQGGGLIDDIDVTITRARFGFGYGGNSSAEDATTFHLGLKDGEGTEYVQYYGTGTGFVPNEAGSEDENGKELVAVDNKTAPSGSSNFALLINSLINAGMPEDILDSGDISAIEGLVGHVNRVPAPKRGGLPKREGKNADREQTILLFTTITTLPGEAPAPKKGVPAKPAAKGTPAAKAAPAKPSAATSELNDELAMEIMGLFAEKGVTSMKKVEITKGLFASLAADNPNKKALISAVTKDEVLKALEGFTFDGKELSQE